MRRLSWPAALLGAVLLCATAAHAQAPACDGGGYLNPQFFRGEAAHQAAVAEQEMRAFIGRTGLPAQPLYSIKRIDDITASGRTPYCWIYSNPVIGLMSGYRPLVINMEPVHPAVLAITNVLAAGPVDAPPVPLKNLPPAEQKAVLDQLQRSRCLGTAQGVEGALVKAEGICAQVEDVAPQSAVGQQGLIAKAAFDWDENAWMGVATRDSLAAGFTMQGLTGRSQKLHQARLVVVPTRNTTVGFGLYVHPSVPEATLRKAAAAFVGITAPSRPLAIALDLGPQFSFAVPTQEQVDKIAASLGQRR